uniref:Putative virion core protein n=2 Tax=viral metagenome TaxID=1070528 RepID=A0A6H1ZRR1_9ZZZZ
MTNDYKPIVLGTKDQEQERGLDRQELEQYIAGFKEALATKEPFVDVEKPQGGVWGFMGDVSGFLHERVSQPFTSRVWSSAIRVIPGDQPGEKMIGRWGAEKAYEEARPPAWFDITMDLANPLYWIPGTQVAKPLGILGAALKISPRLGVVGRATGTGLELGAKGIIGAERAAIYPITKPLGKLFPRAFKGTESISRTLEGLVEGETTAQRAAARAALRPYDDIHGIEHHAAKIMQPDNPSLWKLAQERLGRNRVFRSFLTHTAGPGSVATPDDVVEVVRLGRIGLKEEIRYENDRVLNALIGRRGRPMNLGRIDNEGRVLAVTADDGTNPMWADLFKDVADGIGKYKNVPQELKEYIIDEAKIIKRLTGLLSKHGLRPQEYEMGSVAFHRKVLGWEVEGELLEKAGTTVKGRAGLKPRVHPTMEEGRKAAIPVVYKNDPLDALREQMEAVATLVSQADAQRVLNVMSVTKRELMPIQITADYQLAVRGYRDTKTLEWAIKQVEKGNLKEVHPITWSKMEREFPNIVAQIKPPRWIRPSTETLEKELDGFTKEIQEIDKVLSRVAKSAPKAVVTQADSDILETAKAFISRTKNARGGPRPFVERELDKLQLKGFDIKEADDAFFKFHDLNLADFPESIAGRTEFKATREAAWKDFLNSIEIMKKVPVAGVSPAMGGGQAGKALRITRAGLEAEQEIRRVLLGSGKVSERLANIHEEMVSLQGAISAHATPYNRDAAFFKTYAEIPAYLLDAKEQVYRAFVQDVEKKVTKPQANWAALKTEIKKKVAEAKNEVYRTQDVKKRTQQGIGPTKRVVPAEDAEAWGLKEGPHTKYVTISAEEAKGYNLVPMEQEVAIFTEGEIKGISGRIFPAEVSMRINKIMGDEAKGWLNSISTVSATGRMMIATLDFSAAFIQGLPILGKNPKAWAKAQAMQFKFAANPENLQKYIAHNEQILAEMRASGSIIQPYEYFEALETLTKSFPALKKVLHHTYGRAEAAFTGYSIVARVEMWKGMAPHMAQRFGEKGLRDLATTLDHMVGIMSTKALGLSGQQRAFESAFMFFSPRYTRAGFAFMGDLMKTGASGSLARKSLAGLAAGGTAMYIGTQLAMGRSWSEIEDSLTPTSARFFSLPLGDRRFGVGGFQYSVLRLLGNTSAAIEDVATGEKSWQDILVPVKDGGLNKWDNPIVRFARGRTSVLTGALDEIMEQENYFGEPFETPADWGRFVAGKTLPVWIQSQVVEREGVSGKAAAAEILGLRTFPRSEWEVADELRNRYSQAEHGMSYEELGKTEGKGKLAQEQLDAAHPDIGETLERAHEKQRVSGSDEQKIGREYLDELTRARSVYEEDLWQAQRGFDDGSMTGYDFKERAKTAGAQLGANYDFIMQDPRYADAIERIQGYEPTVETDGDRAYNEFITRIVAASDLEDDFGNFKYSEYRQRIDEFKKRWTATIWDYVQKRMRQDKNEPPLMAELRRAREALRPYWEFRERTLAEAGLTQRADYCDSVGRSNPDAGSACRRMYGINKAETYVARYREWLRMTNPEVAKYYNMFYRK